MLLSFSAEKKERIRPLRGPMRFVSGIQPFISV